ncbi:bifunctional demethylmenaquinone methyltransferase/2-methoxy-6-polyprenyl-1,4-benzoquinol methylase UbiE [Natronospira bacteriovora]|uniref:Ubiquinone/menaquinone biosynthesis C-methyltransferase UbiE n=1 Tax=Natronospira bacteriovora TaxID=3069753 RepID=A0ABU0W750_9GAMM|nr:bifunctional demethylmenaquinone methyltransferase/2-methoxy-6-polyprenyl-1,4-benzoquinol methylase UbiE [Natronospira sp. AB-CW4]MDQ2069858.1 bifunctional demethylmenaquinone methyltransferase/2-methoxy-6-polyprenyl-1,4-benzoquinol methylase UbiE [Natronospira sp. AB-CW4]
MAEQRRSTTDFGFQEVPVEEKARRVRGVFDSVAERYDLMNDLMSGGLHRVWKAFTLARTGLRPGDRALDLAGGTGDLTRGLLRQVGEQGEVVLSDINASMLSRGRDRLVDEGADDRLSVVQANAEVLPFPDRHFDCVTIAFGLRNVTHKDRALAEMHRVLRPGGRLLVLEFSRPNDLIRPFYDLYSFQVLPRLGEWVAGDADSYRYLAESIRKHPDQATLGAMMETAGFARVEWFNLTGGVVALHRGYRA